MSTTEKYVGRMTHTTTHMAAVPVGLTARALGAVSSATGRAAQGLESSSRWLEERAGRAQESVEPASESVMESVESREPEHQETDLITPPFDEPFNEHEASPV